MSYLITDPLSPAKSEKNPLLCDWRSRIRPYLHTAPHPSPYSSDHMSCPPNTKGDNDQGFRMSGVSWTQSFVCHILHFFLSDGITNGRNKHTETFTHSRKRSTFLPPRSWFPINTYIVVTHTQYTVLSPALPFLSIDWGRRRRRDGFIKIQEFSLVCVV